MQSAAPVTVAADLTIAPLPANAKTVPDEDLLKLSALVDLPNAGDRRIDKARWASALPIAQSLAQGPCDCEQRNWLNHFVEMGEAGIAGADEHYYKLASLMTRLARNDSQVTAYVNQTSH